MNRIKCCSLVLVLFDISAAFGNGARMPVDNKKIQQGDCTTQSRTERLAYGLIELPASGQFYLESHLATTHDQFANRTGAPSSSTEQIEQHLERSCDFLATLVGRFDCKRMYDYNAHWGKVWTPAEGGGRFGSGAIGKKPQPQIEPFIFNIKWKRSALPRPGTKYLLSFKDRSLVVIGGYEIGPTNPKVLGGIQVESQYYLGVRNSDFLTLSYLKDQSLQAGPIRCQK